MSNPGIITRFIRSTFGFRKTTLTLFVVLTYLSCFVIVAYYDYIALSPPTIEPEILKNSWSDLQVISFSFHPYDSHANDDVHDYILSRVEHLASLKNYIEVSPVLNSTKFFNQKDVFNANNPANRIIYFEGNNILVKITGKDPLKEGLLISAHYDSVPTAYGTTDDGMGIASMLGILDYFSQPDVKQPERTLIFNFNNQEEFGLLGASLFFEHEYSKLVKYFINLEGTGAGGKSILFRSTDFGILSYYKNAPKPFANSLFQEGFQNGFIRSETDYKVYKENGLRGVDIAFFKPRSLYHTNRDSIKGTTKGSLWHMESNALEMAKSIVYSTKEINDDLSNSIFFDILGLIFIKFSINQLYLLNLILIVVIPTIIIIFLIIVLKRGTWFIEINKGWFRLPISIIISTIVIITSAKFYYINDPLLLSNDYISPLLSLISLFIISNFIILNFQSWFRPIQDQKLVIMLELNFIMWLLLVWSTYEIHFTDNVATYGITIVYILLSTSTIFGLLTMAFKRKPKYEPIKNIRNYGSTSNSNSNSGSRQSPRESVSRGNNDEERLIDNDEVSTVGNSSPRSGTSSNGEEQQQQQQHGGGRSSISKSKHQVTTESSPLLHDQIDEQVLNSEQYRGADEDARIIVVEEESEETFKQKLKHAALKSFSYDWSIQYLIFVPISVFVVFEYGELLLQGLNQTVQESSKMGETCIYILILITISLGSPLLPFIHKLNTGITIFFILILIFSSSFSIFEKPFSYNNPLKLRFLQKIDISNYNDNDYFPSVVNLYGKKGFIESILQDLPSLKTPNSDDEFSVKNVNCTDKYDGSELCVYDGIRPYLFDGSYKDNKFNESIKIEIIKNTNNDLNDGSKYIPFESEFKIFVKDNRNCVLNFNTTKYDNSKIGEYKSPVKIVTVFNDNIKEGEEDGNLIDMEEFKAQIPSGYYKDPKTGNEYFKVVKGIDEFQINKLDWSKEYYHIGINWMFSWEDEDDEDDDKDLINFDPLKETKLGINVQCFWGEYDQDVTIDGDKKRKVEALDELLVYSPDYITYSNLAKGLVEIDTYFEL